jgi:hypothetical protein
MMEIQHSSFVYSQESSSIYHFSSIASPYYLISSVIWLGPVKKSIKRCAFNVFMLLDVPFILIDIY